jgi:hypothetical protein
MAAVAQDPAALASRASALRSFQREQVTACLISRRRAKQIAVVCAAGLSKD